MFWLSLIWGSFLVVVLWLAYEIEKSSVENRVSGANGLIWFLVHAVIGIGGSLIMGLIAWLVADFTSAALLLLGSVAYVVVEGWLSLEWLDRACTAAAAERTAREQAEQAERAARQVRRPPTTPIFSGAISSQGEAQAAGWILGEGGKEDAPR